VKTRIFPHTCAYNEAATDSKAAEDGPGGIYHLFITPLAATHTGNDAKL